MQKGSPPPANQQHRDLPAQECHTIHPLHWLARLGAGVITQPVLTCSCSLAYSTRDGIRKALAGGAVPARRRAITTPRPLCMRSRRRRSGGGERIGRRESGGDPLPSARRVLHGMGTTAATTAATATTNTTEEGRPQPPNRRHPGPNTTEEGRLPAPNRSHPGPRQRGSHVMRTQCWTKNVSL